MNTEPSRIWFSVLSILVVGICALVRFNSVLMAQDIEKQPKVTIGVNDQSGAPISNAQIEILPSNNSAARKLSADGNGELSLELAPGSYDLVVTSPGFRSAARHVVVHDTGRQRLTFVLEVGACPPGVCLTVSATSPSPGDQHNQTEKHGIEFQSVKLFSWRGIGNERKYAEFEELRETRDFHVIPSAKFDVICDVASESSFQAGDYLLWTTVDFLVVPATQEYGQKDADQLGRDVAWEQVTEMQDIKAIPIYLFKPGESRRIVAKDFDLSKTLAAFPPGDANNLWPWLVRLNIQIQDRSGKQIASAHKTLRFWPSVGRTPGL